MIQLVKIVLTEYLNILEYLTVDSLFGKNILKVSCLAF